MNQLFFQAKTHKAPAVACDTLSQVDAYIAGLSCEDSRAIHVVHVVPWMLRTCEPPVMERQQVFLSLSETLYQQYMARGISCEVYPSKTETLTPSQARRFTSSAIDTHETTHLTKAGIQKVWIAPWVAYYTPSHLLQYDEETVSVSVMSEVWQQARHLKPSEAKPKRHLGSHAQEPASVESFMPTVVWVFHHPEVLLLQVHQAERSPETLSPWRTLQEALLEGHHPEHCHHVVTCRGTWEASLSAIDTLPFRMDTYATRSIAIQAALGLVQGSMPSESLSESVYPAPLPLCWVCDTAQERERLMRYLPEGVRVMTFATWVAWRCSEDYLHEQETLVSSSKHALARYRYVFWFSDYTLTAYSLLLSIRLEKLYTPLQEEVFCMMEPEGLLPWFQAVYTALHGVSVKAFGLKKLWHMIKASKYTAVWVFLRYIKTPQCERQRLVQALLSLASHHKLPTSCGVCGPCTGHVSLGWNPWLLLTFLVR
ncbi:MAG: hypothetical protein ACKO37_00090 [Vampirovibrionales bacterium]